MIRKIFIINLLLLFSFIIDTQYVFSKEKIVDGIKFRTGYLDNDFHLRPSGSSNSPDERYIDHNLGTLNLFDHLQTTPIFPVTITFPETLMTSWSFRSAFTEYQPLTERNDLPPYPDDTSISSSTNKLRQKQEHRTTIYNDFFNDSDRIFADANPDWALSADLRSSRIIFGYLWGVFIPISDHNRIIKIGIGPGGFYTDISYKLNLCSQYKVTPNEDGTKHGGECVGKKEIDSASASGVGLSIVFEITLFERVTDDSVWKIFSVSQGETQTQVSGLKLKNHKNLDVGLLSGSTEFISYTYRF